MPPLLLCLGFWVSASSVRSRKTRFSDFRTTFFGGWQPPPDPATGFLRSLWVSRKDSGEFWSGPADAAHQGALNLCDIIEKTQKSTKISENFQIFDFPKIVPRHFLRVPRASAALWDPPWVTFRLVWWSHVTSPHYLKKHCRGGSILEDGSSCTTHAFVGLPAVPGGAPSPCRAGSSSLICQRSTCLGF